MTRVVETAAFAHPAAQVWEWVGDFGGLNRWHPAVTHCRLQPDGTRLLTLADGAEIVERLDGRDAKARTLDYSIVTSPLPVRDYRSHIAVRETAKGCSVEWSSTFEPQGADEAAASNAVRGIYTAGLGRLKHCLVKS
ncbi:MAG: SRPBCC family protein [Gammaproteobacteria bacterium]|nr:SRPBCC family protein [Gammaproteobacteria bacterium]